MSKIILVTGGSRSGKSEFAESLLKDTDDVLYIATAVITDEEMRNRINRHKESRNQNWSTYEGYKNLDEIIHTYGEEYILLDCVTTMITNLLFDKERDFDNMPMEKIDVLRKEISLEFIRLIEKCRELNKTIIMVTNEIGCGLVPEYKLSRIFRDVAGWINQDIAKVCDEVYMTACGIPMKLK